MRGKDTLDVRIRDCLGITPAHAGKSCMDADDAREPGDHPRTCGEKMAPPMVMSWGLGSPPHMRGKGEGRQTAPDRPGITPAHAGKSLLPSASPDLPAGWPGCRDHPRTCGEKSISDGDVCVIMGSPPHMRGKAPAAPRRRSHTGITPAHAGKRTYVIWMTRI